MTERWFPVPTVIVEPGIKTGMPILYDNPREVGADRIADAVAAYEGYGGPTVVIDFGTATTFEAISGKGEYLGGAILPGIEISMEALFARASLITRVELVAPGSIIGKNTVESLQAGAVYGFAAQVDGLCAPLRSRARPLHRGGHWRPGQHDHPGVGGYRPPGTVADPRRPAHHLRAQQPGLTNRTG